MKGLTDNFEESHSDNIRNLDQTGEIHNKLMPNSRVLQKSWAKQWLSRNREVKKSSSLPKKKWPTLWYSWGIVKYCAFGLTHGFSYRRGTVKSHIISWPQPLNVPVSGIRLNTMICRTLCADLPGQNPAKCRIDEKRATLPYVFYVHS